MKRFIKTVAVIITGLIITLMVAFGFVGNYFFDFAISTEKDKQEIFDHYQAYYDTEQRPTETQEQADSEIWVQENANDIYETARDGLKLHAYELRHEDTENHKWVIAVHGYASEGIKMSGSAQHFYNTGYHVLIPDLRGSGKSEGDVIGMGWLDRLDLLKWINTVVEQDPESQILLYGVSMGGAAVMMTTGEKLPGNVKAAVEDCGYTSVREEFDVQIQEIFNVSPFPVIDAASIVTFFRGGYTFEEASAVEQVKKSKTPTLFIHGDADTFVPFFMLDKVYEAASCPKQKLVIEGAAHAQASNTDPDLYWSTVDAFAQKYMQE